MVNAESLGVPGSSPTAGDIFFFGVHTCSDPNCSNSWDIDNGKV